MKTINTKNLMVALGLLALLVGIPMLSSASQKLNKVYKGYEKPIEAGIACIQEGQSRCVEGEMIFRCYDGQWQPKEVCVWGCKTHRMCRI